MLSLWGALSDERSGLSFFSQEWEKGAGIGKGNPVSGICGTNKSMERKFKDVSHFTKTKANRRNQGSG
jgi:hypothetical protein